MEDPIREAKNGNAEYFQSVELDVIQKARDEDNGCSVLYWAAINGHLRCCDVIYRRCPQLLYEVGNIGSTPLQQAAWFGREEIIKYLLTCKAKLEQEAQSSSGGEEVYSRLLMMVSTTTNETALHLAARQGHLGSAKILIEADVSNELLGMKTISNRTAMHWAVQCNQFDMVKLLVETDPGFQYYADKYGNTPLLIALEQAISGDEKATAG